MPYIDDDTVCRAEEIMCIYSHCEYIDSHCKRGCKKCELNYLDNPRRCVRVVRWAEWAFGNWLMQDWEFWERLWTKKKP